MFGIGTVSTLSTRHYIILVRLEVLIAERAETLDVASELEITQQKPMCHFNLGNLMSSSGTSLTANVEILGLMGNSIVGGVCSLTSEALVNLNKGVPPPAYFDWRGWFRAGLPFFRDDFEMRRPLLPNLTHPHYPITPEAAQRFLLQD
ncbi:hypothetical protein J6590_085719 [Homalodisca vitripennis]|nr:hypothetical protein J6590_085719 [Homalodisca vitripennis]